MIPAQNIVAWANVVPWVEPRQVEQDLIISRAQAQERIFAKLARPRLWLDVRPLLPADRAAAQTTAAQAQSFQRVFMDLIDRLPGKPWARTAAMKARFGIEW